MSALGGRPHPTPAMSLREQLQQTALQAGWNVVGLADTRRFDASQPVERRCSRVLGDSGTAMVFAAAGRDAVQAGQPIATSRGGSTIKRLRSVLRAHGQRGAVVAMHRAAGPVRTLGLAESAGVGVVSPVLGVLLHPRYGPWVEVRAVVFLADYPFGAIVPESLAENFQPCASCARHCLEVCPVGGHAAVPADAACGEHRGAGGCSAGCAARAACPLGPADCSGGTAEPVAVDHAWPAVGRSAGTWHAVRQLFRSR
jgi:hypothetical protein